MRARAKQILNFSSSTLRHSYRGIWVLLLIGLLSAVAAAGSMADEPPQAGLVVQMDGRHAETRCLSLGEDEVSGAELLVRSGLDVVLDPASGMGLIVCQIEEVGCAHPAEPCFCQCMGGGDCIYWNYFFKEPGQNEWTYSALGAAMHKVKAGSVDAWVWGDGNTPPSAELGFDAICAPPTPVPSRTPEPLPTASSLPAVTPTAPSAEAPLATELPSTTPDQSTVAPSTPSPASQDTATALSPTATPSPTPNSGPNLVAYFPFALILLGLAGVGGIAWLRRR